MSHAVGCSCLSPDQAYCLTDSLTGSDLKAERDSGEEGEKSQSGFRSFGRNESLQSESEQREDGSIYFMLSALFSKCE